MTPEQLRAIADRLEAAETAVLAAQRDLWLLAADLPGEVVDAIDSPALGSDDGARVSGGVDLVADSPGAPIPEPGQAGAADPLGTPAPATDAGAVRDGRRPTRSEGVGSTPTPRSSSLLFPVPHVDGGYDCPVCGRFFPSKRGFPAHARGHTGGDAQTNRQAAARDRRAALSGGAQTVSRKETYLCARCPESFPSAAKRDEHQRFHMPVPVVAGPVGRGPRSVVDRVATGGGPFDE